MDICFQKLDCSNPVLHKGISIGESIRNTGKLYLWEDRASSGIDVIVIHYMSAVNVNSASPYSLPDILQIFVDYGVSSHYLISRDGNVYNLVPEEKKAWHCGPSFMPPPDNRENVNDFSIGIELVGTDVSGFTNAQYAALCSLSFQIEIRYNRHFTYVGHEDIAGVEAVEAGLRSVAKTDPGPLFDWNGFYSCMENLRNRNHRDINRECIKGSNL
jgi:N-acetyl-anhydromuramyl-L-alanine amidase AmpD